MSDDPDEGAGSGRRYHHGDLRRGLLRAAREEVARHGAGRVSLSALARLAGVSQSAPYRHFSDRDALLEAVAAEAFETFSRQLTDARAGKEPRAALAALKLAYVRFGEANVELYRLMFTSRLVPEAATGNPLDRAANSAFAVLREAVSASSERIASDRDAYLVWAELHGLVMLKADGFILRPLASYVEGLPPAPPASHQAVGD